ncbi:hypothetical protein BGZ54_008200 [Gamsiella multidivaricata]|nr:hypothetical protein BGZ54_008200 [Gamsiella multidivaricata]
MTDDSLTLLCLVDGLPSSKAFEIEVSATRTVAHLKDLIKTKQTPAFDDITVDQLILWSVAISVVAANKHKPIFLNEYESATDLDPTDGLSDVFEDAA